MALVHRRGKVGYSGLEAVADRCASRLAELGVRPGAIVPVLLPRGPELIAALIAIGNLGAACAALDPRWPDARIRQICSMLEPAVAVTNEPARVKQATYNPMDLFATETSPPAGHAAGDAAGDAAGPPGIRWPRTRVPLPRAEAGHGTDSDGALFSVFFTSGSAGQPKAIPVTRRAVTGLLAPGAMPLRLGPDTVMTVAAPAPWDAFALELWGPLLNGGTCILEEGDYLSPGQLRENVARYGQNTVWLTSSLFSLFVEEDLGSFDGITQVVTGGERLSPEHAREFLLAYPGTRLFNGYGPAENCVFATMHPVTAEDCALPTGIPIGRPVGGTGVHILDGDRACPAGELGEICLAGPRLSRGYLGDPDATGRVFVTAELDGRQTRIYRTGDLGWQDESGRYHFHGRADRQVKVRGHRVEPAEIERHVAAHPAVAQCVVVPVVDPGGTATALAACYRARGAVHGEDLRGFARARLPGYLVPEHWVPVDRIPMLANGKVNLDELRARAGRAGHDRSPGQEEWPPDCQLAYGPADPLLAELRGLARETAGLGAVPPEASLVAAGANSLQLIRLCLRAGQRWGVRLEPAGFFRQPTLTHLAALIRQAIGAGGAGEAGGAGGGANAMERPLNPVQSAFLFTEAIDPANRRAWHCTLAWRIEGNVDERALAHAIGSVHRRHPALHARYATAPPFRTAQTRPPTSPEFTVLSCATVREARVRLDEALHALFVLDRGPAWRAVLARVAGSDVAMFGVCVHHVAFDGWSERVLVRDLAAAYASHRSGAPGGGQWFAEPMPWPAEDDTRGRWQQAEGQRRELEGELAGTPALKFPAPAPASGRAVGERSEVIVRRLDAGQAGRCHALAREHATTPFVIGLAGYAAAASRLTGLTDFAVITPVAQRNPGNEDAVGCLLNLLCLRLRLPSGPGDPAAVIEAAKSAARRALLTQDVPFPQAVGLLAPPVIPHLFVLQQNPVPELELPGCRTSLHRPVQHYAGFEFQLELRLPGTGAGEVVVTYRRAAVDDGFVSSLTGAFTDFVTPVATA